MRKILGEEKFEVWERELPFQFLPDSEELKKAVEFGREFAKRVLKS
jgi:hypothetical protein